ncbi:hypothetical protein MnTg02_02426 [bacterium MnTg02]|nr:hypothetical protein MnTg02_02426 [bacterium MnTg02]
MICEGGIVSLGDLLSRLPDIQKTFGRWKQPNFIRFRSEKIKDSDEAILTVRRKQYRMDVDVRKIKQIAGDDCIDLISSDDKELVFQTKKKGKIGGFYADTLIGSAFKLGDIVLVAPYPSRCELNKISQLFSVSYILSMFVRYHPSSWMGLIQQQTDDSVLPSILATINCIEILFPQIVSDFLEE